MTFINDLWVVGPLVIVIGAAGVGIYNWIRTLNDIDRFETDEKERRKWWLRVFLLRFAGVIWYRRGLAQKDDTDPTAD